MASKIIPTGGQIAHQALLQLGVIVLLLVVVSQVPGVKAWLKANSDGLPV